MPPNPSTAAASPTLLPAQLAAKALNCIRERRAGLEVYLDDPDVAIDTNHLERALRVIPMGRNYAQPEIMTTDRHRAAPYAAIRAGGCA